MISTLIKCFPRKLQDKVASKNLEFGKTLSEAQSQIHAGMTQIPVRWHPSAGRPFPQMQVWCKAGLLIPTAQKALTVEGSEHTPPRAPKQPSTSINYLAGFILKLLWVFYFNWKCITIPFSEMFLFPFPVLE